MNHIVPDFETDDDFITPHKSTMGGDEEIMELLWHNGQVVMQSQNQRSKKPETRPSTAAGTREIRSSAVGEDTRPSYVFIQEDEMASWLQYPLEDNPIESYYLYNNNNDLVSSTPPPPASITIPSRPPVPPYRRLEVDSGHLKNVNLTRFTGPNSGTSPELGLASSSKILQTTIVPTTEAKAPESRASRVSEKRFPVCLEGGCGVAGTSPVWREIETCDMSVTSSPGSGGSWASACMERLPEKPQPETGDRKRKGIEADDNEAHSENCFEWSWQIRLEQWQDVEFEYGDGKKQSQVGSTATKRSRAAEVHNLSERRRRDRINEKMKALQELIPRCNKSDKASMLDEAIEYLKSLQMQVQMMSMGCNMVPMMFPGVQVQQYMPPPMAMGMGMNMGMGMGMGMDMGMNRAMVPYPAILPGSSMPNPAAAAAAAAQLSQCFPVPGFNMSPVTIAGPPANLAANMPIPMMNTTTINSQNQPQVPNFADPFPQYLGLHQTQLPLPQNQGGVPLIATKSSSSKDATNPDHNQNG